MHKRISIFEVIGMVTVVMLLAYAAVWAIWIMVDGDEPPVITHPYIPL